LFFSTSGVYGYVDPLAYPIKEDHFGSLDPTDLASCYLESKRMGENMCIAWLNQYGIPVKIVRPAITYGPGVKLDDGRSFADFISNIVNNQDIALYSDGQVLRNYCYIADVTLGFFIVLLKGETGQAYNVATDQEIRVVDLAHKLANEIFPEKKLKVVMRQDQTRKYLRVDSPRTAVDITKLKALGWKLNFPLAEGFRRTVKSYG
jgi:nucleoside-diphosphate-sugar epimerase